MLSEKDIQKAIDEPPQSPAVKNANYHVHAGATPQRPYARLEDMMGGNRGWPSYDAIPKEADIKRAEDGSYYRVRLAHNGRSVEKNGRLYNELVPERRGVALTREMALAASQNGTPTDWYDGTSWVINGRKRSADRPENLGTGFDREIVLVEAAPDDQALHLQRKTALAAAAPVVPQAEAQPAKKEK